MKNKYYINVRDYQGGSWAMGLLMTLKQWKILALQWCDSDGNEELYDEIKKHELNDELLDIINEIWTIEIVEFNKENINKILDNYGVNEYYWLLDSVLDIIK